MSSLVRVRWGMLWPLLWSERNSCSKTTAACDDASCLAAGTQCQSGSSVVGRPPYCKSGVHTTATLDSPFGYIPKRRKNRVCEKRANQKKNRLPPPPPASGVQPICHFLTKTIVLPPFFLKLRLVVWHHNRMRVPLGVYIISAQVQC